MQKLLLNSILFISIITSTLCYGLDEANQEVVLESSNKSIKQIASDMEELLLLQFLKELHKPSEISEEKSSQMTMQQELLVMQYATLISKKHSFGIKEHIENKLNNINYKYQQNQVKNGKSN